MYPDWLETHRQVLSRRGPAYSQRLRSNRLIICLTVRKANSYFIFDGRDREGVHIYHINCLRCIDYNEAFRSESSVKVKYTKNLYNGL